MTCNLRVSEMVMDLDIRVSGWHLQIKLKASEEGKDLWFSLLNNRASEHVFRVLSPWPCRRATQPWKEAIVKPSFSSPLWTVYQLKCVLQPASVDCGILSQGRGMVLYCWFSYCNYNDTHSFCYCVKKF